MTDPNVVVLIDVDRLEQRLVAQPAVRVVGCLVDVGRVRQQGQRVIEVRAGEGILAVVGVDPVLDRLQRCRDPILLPLEQLQRDRSRVVSAEQLFSLVFELRSPCGEVRQFRGTLGHHLVEPCVQHRRERVLGLRADLDVIVELLDEPLDVLDEHRLAGAVAPAAVPAAADEVRKDRALAALRVADDQSGAALPAEHRSFQVVLVHLRRVRR